MLARSGQMLFVLGWMIHYYRKEQSVAHFLWQCPSCLFTVLPSDEVCDYDDFTLPQSPAGYSPLELALPAAADILCDSFNGI